MNRPLRLTLVRHAKSDWGDPSLADFDRPLNARGERSAALMAKLLASEGFKPDRILSSPALRALTTARAFAEAAGIDPDSIVTEPEIYEAPPARIAAAIRRTPNPVQHLAVFGHNPGTESLTHSLVCHDEPPHRFVTCAVAELELLVDSWADLDHECASLTRFRYPKMFADV